MQFARGECGDVISFRFQTWALLGKTSSLVWVEKKPEERKETEG